MVRTCPPEAISRYDEQPTEPRIAAEWLFPAQGQVTATTETNSERTVCYHFATQCGSTGWYEVRCWPGVRTNFPEKTRLRGTE
jgi:hypothetical protein